MADFTESLFSVERVFSSDRLLEAVFADISVTTGLVQTSDEGPPSFTYELFGAPVPPLEDLPSIGVIGANVTSITINGKEVIGVLGPSFGVIEGPAGAATVLAFSDFSAVEEFLTRRDFLIPLGGTDLAEILPPGVINDPDAAAALFDGLSFSVATGDFGPGETIIIDSVVGEGDPPDPSGVEAKDDVFITAEDTVLEGNVLSDNGFGEDKIVTSAFPSIIDGRIFSTIPFEVLELPSGAKVSLDDLGFGDLTYDPDGAFDSLRDGELAVDSFRYQLIGPESSDVATVTVTIQGVSDAPELLTGGDDREKGTSGGDSFSALGGDDRVAGLAGDDLIRGGAGDDTLIGARDDDTIKGGVGKDLLKGGVGDDLLQGGGGRDTLNGGGGKDTLQGKGGKDDLAGGGGRDVLEGGGGGDTLDGGGGRDLILGGKGRDVLAGGGGRDLFVFNAGEGRKTVTDYRDGKDKIQFAVGVDGFDNLTLIQRGDDVLIRTPESGFQVRLNDTSLDDLDPGDFMF